APFVAWKSKRLPIWRGACGFRQRSDEIGSEGAPNLDPERRLGAPPKDDLRFVEDRAGRRADGEGGCAQVEGHPALIARAAMAPPTSSATWRCEMSTRLWGIAPRAASISANMISGRRPRRSAAIRPVQAKRRLARRLLPPIRARAEGRRRRPSSKRRVPLRRRERRNESPAACLRAKIAAPKAARRRRGGGAGQARDRRAVLVVENRRRDCHGDGAARHRGEEFRA